MGSFYTEISGYLRGGLSVSGRLSLEYPLTGYLTKQQSVSGSLSVVENITGNLHLPFGYQKGLLMTNDGYLENDQNEVVETFEIFRG